MSYTFEWFRPVGTTLDKRLSRQLVRFPSRSAQHALGGSHTYLNEYIRKNNYKRIMEIGVYTGDNAVRMVETAIERAPDGREVAHYGFDLFLTACSDQVGRQSERLGCTFALFEGDTLETLPTSAASLPKMGLIFMAMFLCIFRAHPEWLQ
jgi:hypothetical protein